jgi:YrbI family 3-deoxy-D-manno-octulosonate 8-phosphate phosphatase
MMTSENSEIVTRRAEKLEITRVFLGVRDKLAQLTSLCQALKLPLTRVAYVGDDVNDLDVIRNVGLGFAVADADSRVLDAAKVRLSKRGGAGAVREAADWVLERARQT